ncbi:MAG: O-antigen ligase family protein, partial [Planctomycetaceae bacterium]
GKTLWITQLWLAAGLTWLLAAVREGRRTLRLDWLDAAVWLIVAGHAVSALFVVTRGDGQARAALTGLWEWIGLGLSFFLIRQVIRTFDEGRRLALIMVALTVALAGLGLWQHYVWYPRIVREYAAVRTELDQLTSAPRPATAAEAQRRSERIEQLRYELTRQNVPLQGPGLVLFESRLRASSEPFGTFSLANTFAGLLVAWLIVGTATTFQTTFQRYRQAKPTGRARWVLFLALLALALIAFCLVLTKSRTAWVGLIVGLAAWGGLRRVRGGTLSPRWIWGPAAVAVVALAAFALAGLSGGFDREVLLEAPKSLSYRVQYWTGAMDVLRERPLFGTGPGNFRQHYLHVKPPEASEEIADPHNAVLDLWTSGGVIALAGAIWLIVLLCRRARFAKADDAPPSKPTPQPSRPAVSPSSVTPLTVGAAMGFGLIIVLRLLLPGDLLLTGGSTARDLALGAGWLLAMGVFARAW